MWCTTHFDVLNHLGTDHQLTDGWTDRQNYDSNSACVTRRAKNEISHSKVGRCVHSAEKACHTTLMTKNRTGLT